MRVSVVFNRQDALHARAYYAAEALGKLDEIHPAFFAEIHERGNPLATETSIAELFARFGIDAEAFRAALRSPDVNEKVQRGIALGRSLGVDAAPSLVVARRYLTSPSIARSLEDTFVVAHVLARYESGARQAPACTSTLEPQRSERAGEALRSPSGDDLAPPTLAALLDRIRAGCPRDGRF